MGGQKPHICADSVILGRQGFMVGNGLFVPTFIPCHRLANDTPQFLIEGLGKAHNP
jgi:hypothetical protein